MSKEKKSFSKIKDCKFGINKTRGSNSFVNVLLLIHFGALCGSL